MPSGSHPCRACENIALLDRVAPPTSADEASAPHRSRGVVFERSGRDRVLTGVAGGLADRLGVDPTVIRLAFVSLSLAAGIGIVLYLLAYLAAVEPAAAAAEPPPTSIRQSVAIGLIVLGVLLLLRQAGVWFGDALVWPMVLVALGSAVIWTRAGERDRSRLFELAQRLPVGSQELVLGRGPIIRLAVGAVLLLSGVAGFLTSGDLSANAPIAVTATVLGLGVIAGPGVWRLGRQLTEERRERIRSQERAEVAAHLHDSVLQTLALIQRSGEPREMAALARAQERELRAWLYGGARATDQASLRTAIDETAAGIERTHSVALEVVVVGDCPIDERTAALVLAIREAIVNAAIHSGSSAASVYVEVEEDRLTGFVRDHGSGFVPGDVPPDRRGIRDSIEGRVARFGGSAQITSARGHGTEVRLLMPRNGS